MSEQLVGALVLAVVCAALALPAPRVIQGLPEPDPEPDAEQDPEHDADRPRDAEDKQPKELYADMARVRGLGMGIVVGAGVVGAVVGWRLGWGPALLPWAFFVPLAVLLGVVDWRVRLLPTRVIAPSYGVLVVLVLVGTLLAQGWGPLIGAAVGWAVFGVVYFLLWFVNPGGLGYGDVRLSGLIGLSLGFVGGAAVLSGLLAGSLLGGLGALALRIVRGQKYVPYGPFMLAGALVGLLTAPGLHSLGY